MFIFPLFYIFTFSCNLSITFQNPLWQTLCPLSSTKYLESSNQNLLQTLYLSPFSMPRPSDTILAFSDEKQSWSYLACLWLSFPHDKTNHQLRYFNIARLKIVHSSWTLSPVTCVWFTNTGGTDTGTNALKRLMSMSQAICSNSIFNLRGVMLEWRVTGNNLEDWKLHKQAKM